MLIALILKQFDEASDNAVHLFVGRIRVGQLLMDLCAVHTVSEFLGVA